MFPSGSILVVLSLNIFTMSTFLRPILTVASVLTSEKLVTYIVSCRARGSCTGPVTVGPTKV